MARYGFVTKRVVGIVPLLLGVILAVFALQQVTPGDPARLILGARASEEAVQELRSELRLDDPVATQFVRYAGNVFQGDLGRSLRASKPVTSIIADRLPVTLYLLGAGVVLSLLISIPLGTWAAMRQGGWVDHAIRSVSLLGLTLPPFWVGIMLLLFVALPTGWFPITGFGDTFNEHLRSITLPALTLAISLAPIQIRSLRSAMIEVAESDAVTTARSLGIKGWRLVSRQVIPNAVLPMITLLAVEVGYMLFGAVVVESTFSLPGLGSEMITAVAGRDFAVVQGITLVFALMVVGIHLLADIAHAFIDPRLEMT